MPAAEQDLGFGRTYRQLAGRNSMHPPAKDVIVESGKKMASDLREGLWTFFEDIRQATVGEEGINGIDSRSADTGHQQRQGQRRIPVNEDIRHRAKMKKEIKGEKLESEGSNMVLCGVEGPPPSVKTTKSFWKEFGLDTPSNNDKHNFPNNEQRTPVANAPLVELDDNWDDWESPAMSQTSPKHDLRMEEKLRSSSDGLPWPELKHLTPSRLSRTVSDLMKEWESPGNTQQMSPAGLDDQALASPHI
jgi:Domain of unknown function (DUF4048)